MSLPYDLKPEALVAETTHGDVVVRPVGLGDQAQWMRLWGLYLEFYETELPKAQFEQNWERLFDPKEPMFGFLAERGGEPCGLVHIIFHRSFWLDGPSCYLQDLYADRSTRGTGVGRALIEHVYGVAKAAGAERVHWLTKTSNETARLLYDRIARETGFIQYAQVL